MNGTEAPAMGPPRAPQLGPEQQEAGVAPSHPGFSGGTRLP